MNKLKIYEVMQKAMYRFPPATLSLSRSSCLHTRQPGTVFKKLDTRQSEILTNFLEIARLIPLRT